MRIKVKIPEDLVFKFGGGSLWSSIKEQRDIRITGMLIRYIDSDFGELRVYFDTDDWPETNGLIYTDYLFCQ